MRLLRQVSHPRKARRRLSVRQPAAARGAEESVMLALEDEATETLSTENVWLKRLLSNRSGSEPAFGWVLDEEEPPFAGASEIQAAAAVDVDEGNLRAAARAAAVI